MLDAANSPAGPPPIMIVLYEFIKTPLVSWKTNLS
jgi:hypothetical protein